MQAAAPGFYLCCARVMAREGPELSSAPIGFLEAGTRIEGISSHQIAVGSAKVTRVQFSCNTGDVSSTCAHRPKDSLESRQPYCFRWHPSPTKLAASANVMFAPRATRRGWVSVTSAGTGKILLQALDTLPTASSSHCVKEGSVPRAFLCLPSSAKFLSGLASLVQ